MTLYQPHFTALIGQQLTNHSSRHTGVVPPEEGPLIYPPTANIDLVASDVLGETRGCEAQFRLQDGAAR